MQKYFFTRLAPFLLLGACASGSAVPSQTATNATSAAGAPAQSTADRASAPPPIGAAAFDVVRDVEGTRSFTIGEPQRMTPSADGRFVFFLKASPDDPRNSLWEVEVATGAIREILRPDAILAGAEKLSAEEKARRERARIRGAGFAAFEATNDGGRVLVQLSGKLYSWERATGKARELAAGPGAIDPHLSPDGTKVAYVRNGDVYVLPLDGGREMAVTRGGTEMNPHGVADFMAQEEFYRWRGFWWSPDGRAILYEDQDVSKLPKWTLADPGNPEAPAQIVSYPQVGAPNAVVRLMIAEVPAQAGPLKAPRAINWDAARYPYLISATWSKNAPPTLYVLDRLYQHGALLAVDPARGTSKPLVTEEDPAWLGIDPSVPRWLPDGQSFLWSSERSGHYELELHDRDGKKLSTVTAGAMGYRRLYAVDPEQKIAYVSASDEPNRSELWAAPFDGGTPHAKLRDPEATVAAVFGGPHLYAFSRNDVRGEHHFGVRSLDGKIDIAIPSSAKPPPFVPKLEYTTVGKYQFRAVIIRPRDFDPGRRYPVVDDVYGPHVYNMVSQDGRRYLEDQWIADQAGVVVVSIDTRGTMYRGRDWMRALYKHFGDLVINDHADAITELAKRYPELDASRVGMFGWSGGGYMSAMAVLQRPDFYKAAVAGAAVSDLHDYDAIMEMVLGAYPSDVYAQSSLLTWAARPPSAEAPARPLLVIQGTSDDNVYPIHALKLMSAMQRAGRPVEFMPLLGQTHMVSTGDEMAAAKKRTAEYFRDHLSSAASEAPR